MLTNDEILDLLFDNIVEVEGGALEEFEYFAKIIQMSNTTVNALKNYVSNNAPYSNNIQYYCNKLDALKANFPQYRI